MVFYKVHYEKNVTTEILLMVMVVHHYAKTKHVAMDW